MKITEYRKSFYGRISLRYNFFKCNERGLLGGGRNDCRVFLA